MSQKNENAARAIAERIVQLARAAHGYPAGLSPAQWNALRYVSRANRFSRTVSAFAEFNGTTRGTASQTVKALVGQGYLSRERSSKDGRSATLELTDEAKSLLSRDPLEALVYAACSLPTTTRKHLEAGLERLLGKVAQADCKPPFGICASCAHLDEPVCAVEPAGQHECSFFGESLDDAELDLLCVNFRPG